MGRIDPELAVSNNSASATDMTAEALYDKCMALAKNLWWTWHPEVISFRDLDPIRWRQLDHNPIALLREFTPERLATRAAEMVLYSRINYAYRRLKGTCHHADLGGHARRRVGFQARRLFLGGVRHARVGADLFGWSRSPVGRPHQERQRTGRAAGRRRPTIARAISGSSWTRTATSARSISTRRSRTCRWSRPVGADGKPITVAIDTRTGHAVGQGLADAGRPRATCTCSTATSRETAPKIAS